MRILMLGNSFTSTNALPQRVAQLTGVDVVVFGHSHKYVQEEKDGLLWLNPGSCGPRRFHQEITMMIAQVENGQIQVERIDIPHPEI